MEENRWKVLLLHGLLLGLLAGMMTLLLLGNYGSRRQVLRATGGYQELTDLTMTEVPFEDYAGIQQTYTTVLPQVPDGGDGLAIYLVHQYAEVYLDEELVAESHEEPGFHLGRSPGCYWFRIPLTTRDTGRTLRIVTRPLYDIVADRAPVVAMSTFETVLSTWVLRYAWELFLCAMSMIGGVVFMLVFLTYLGSRQEFLRMLYLGAFTVSVGMWRLFDLPVVSLLTPGGARLFYYLAMLGMMFSPPLFARMLHYMPTRRARLYGQMSILLALEDLVLLALQLLGILDLRQAIYVVFGTLFVAMIPVFVQGIINLIRRDESRLQLSLNLLYIGFVLALGADMLQYLVFRGPYHLYLLATVTVVHLFVMGVILGRRSMRRMELAYANEVELEHQRSRLMLSQIQPHFLYNALAVIRELCYSDPAKAEEATVRFSQYLRQNMDSLTAEGPIPFTRELEHVRNYLALEQLRFGDNLRVRYDIGTEDFQLPPLSLQPLVENAVRHGIRKREDGGTVTIRVRQRPEGVEIWFWTTGRALTRSTCRRTAGSTSGSRT